MMDGQTDGQMDRAHSREMDRKNLHTLAAKRKLNVKRQRKKKKICLDGEKNEERRVQGGAAGLRTRALVLHFSEHNICY